MARRYAYWYRSRRGDGYTVTRIVIRIIILLLLCRRPRWSRWWARSDGSGGGNDFYFSWRLSLGTARVRPNNRYSCDTHLYMTRDLYSREQAKPVDGAVKSVRAHKLLCHSRLWTFRVQRSCRYMTDEKLKTVLDNNTDLSTCFSKPTTGSGFVFYTLLPVHGYWINTFIV